MLPDRLKPFLPFLVPYRREIIIGIAALLVTDFVGLVIPWLLKGFIDLLPQRPGDMALLKYSGLLFLAATVQALGRYGWRRFMFGPSRKVECDVLNSLFEQFLSLDKTFYLKQKVGDLMSRATNDIRAIRDFVGLGLLILIDSVVVIIACISVMFWIHPRLTLYVIIPLPVVSILFFTYIREMNQRHQAVQEHLAKLSAHVQENLAGIRALHAFVQEETEKRRFDDLNREYIRKNLSVTKLSGIFPPSLVFTVGIAAMIALWIGGKAVVAGEMSLGSFVAYNGYLMMLSWPMMGIGYVFNLTQKGFTAMGRIQEIFAARSSVEDKPVKATPKTIDGDIEFRNFRFSYPESGSESVAGVSLKIPRGGSLGLLGLIGSGKTTLVQMIPRLFDPEVEDCLWIDGRPIRDFPISVLRESVGYVSQEPFLFSMSIRNNIALGAPEAPDDEIARAVRISGLEPDLERFPEGLDTIVGGRGVSLSGGQKQRIALARAVLKKPKILILDDAFSNLDAETEERIFNALKDLIRGTTTLMISNRLSVLSNLDHIAVMEEGRIIDQGSPRELMGRDGVYSRIRRHQALALEMEITLQ